MAGMTTRAHGRARKVRRGRRSRSKTDGAAAATRIVSSRVNPSRHGGRPGEGEVWGRKRGGRRRLSQEDGGGERKRREESGG